MGEDDNQEHRMDDFSPSDLKTILHSKRANLYYLQHCRVLVNGGRVEYVTDEGSKSRYWNIPIANTTSILLGTGTSITQAAMRELAKAGVLVGFCGGGGTLWTSRVMKDAGFSISTDHLHSALNHHREAISKAPSTIDLLTLEARLTKTLFKLAVNAVDYVGFTRAKRGTGTDPANRFLDHGNYLAYGLGATATWVLGIPHGLAVLHGKTRRGGLVFDVADLVKDAVILPQAFISAMRGDEEQEFRQACIERLTRTESLDFMTDTLKDVAQALGSGEA